MNENFKILVVDDDEVSRNLLSEVLKKEGFIVSLARSGEEAVLLLDRTTFPLILSDIRMLEVSGLQLLRVVKRISPESVVTLMTGFGSMEGALEAIREGAFDYISKPFKLEDLKALLQKAKRHFQAQTEKNLAGTPPVEKLRDQGLIGKSQKIVEVYKTIARAAFSTANVLISGEIGTGKALVARMIHEHSTRLKGPLVSWSPEEGLEGLEKSFQDARGGTLVFEELVGLTGVVQSRILKMIEAAESNGSDVRFVALTRSALSDLSGKSTWSDLVSRFNVISIQIPPLRERMEDLPELTQYFLAKHSDRNRKAVSHLSPEALQAFNRHTWPENIRELERAIERAVVLTGGSVLEAEDFIFLNSSKTRKTDQRALTSLDTVEKDHILKVLEETGFNKSRASEVLGIDRATLYRKAKHYQIELKKSQEG